MSLTQEQITRLAKLTALNADSHIEIDSVLDSFDAVKNTDTSSVHAISRSGQPKLILREDSVHEDETIADKLLAESPQKIAAHQIVLAGIMHGE